MRLTKGITNMKLICTRIIATFFLYILASNVAVGQIKLYKDISLGDGWNKTIGSVGYYDCSENGLKIACLDDQKFLGATGVLAVIFESDVASRVIFYSQDLSLYQQSIKFFPSKGFSLVGIETSSGASDFVAMVKKLGAAQAFAKITEAEQHGLSTGFVKYTLLEFDRSNIQNFGNMVEAYASLNSGDRALTISVSEEPQGIDVSITFEPSLVDLKELQTKNAVSEDF